MKHPNRVTNSRCGCSLFIVIFNLYYFSPDCPTVARHDFIAVNNAVKAFAECVEVIALSVIGISHLHRKKINRNLRRSFTTPANLRSCLRGQLSRGMRTRRTSSASYMQRAKTQSKRTPIKPPNTSNKPPIRTTNMRSIS